MDYSDRLRALPRPDLEELLARRPETSALLSRPAAGHADLAGLLAQPQNVRRAVASLDRFHRQVLELACVMGGRLEPEIAAQEGLDPALLRGAARELARWGLGFPDRQDLRLPDCVLAAVDDPGRVGGRAASLLDHTSVVDLRTIATILEARPRAIRKADLLRAIADRLHDDAFVRDLVADAPPKAARILQAIRAAGGASSWSELAREVPAVHEERGLWYAPLRPLADGIGWLRARALVVWIEWERRLLVPAEAELALRGRVFRSWEPEPPALQLAPLESDRHPVELVTEVDGLLDVWRREPPPLLQSGQLGVRECRRAAAGLGVPETAVRFLASLAHTAGLVAVEEQPPHRRRGRAARRQAEPPARRLLVVDEAVRDWSARDAVERWTALVAPWRSLVDHPDEPLRLVLDALAALPEGQGVIIAGLAERLAWRHPAVFADAAAAIPTVSAAVATLHRLGVGGGPAGPVAGLGDLGRAVLRGDAAEDLDALFPAVESECTVQADLRVIVAGPPDPVLGRALARLADLETASPARVYRLSEASLRRALDDGMSAAEIAGLLASRSRTDLPQNVGALIEDVTRRHGRLRVGRAALYVQADDPALLAEVAANRRLRGLAVTVLSPTVAVIDGATEAQVLEVLRRAGYMPRGVDEPAPAAVPAGPRRRRLAAAHRPPATRRGPTDRERRELAGRLLAAAPPAPPRELDDTELLSGVTVTERDDVERLLRLAVDAGLAVEIEYRNEQSGSLTRRVIEPRLAADDAVIGWCRLRGGDRAFAFSGMRWARATGETVAHVGLGLERT